MATKFTTVAPENRNATTAEKTARFPKMQEVVEVGLLF